MAIRAILFDFGNVLAFFGYGRNLTKLTSAAGGKITKADIQRKIIDSGLLAQFESGKITTPRFLTQLKTSLGLMHISDEVVTQAWVDIFTPNHAVLAVIPCIPRDIRLVLASNTNALHFTYVSQQFRDTLDRFDDFVVSYKEGHMKPDEQFFEACIKAARCDAAECVYFDDVESYVHAAQQLGIQGVTYAPEVDIEKEMVTRGIMLS